MFSFATCKGRFLLLLTFINQRCSHIEVMTQGWVSSRRNIFLPVKWRKLEETSYFWTKLEYSGYNWKILKDTGSNWVRPHGTSTITQTHICLISIKICKTISQLPHCHNNQCWDKLYSSRKQGNIKGINS